MHTQTWDYLIVTASNAAQAQAYTTQIERRRVLGLLTGVRDVLVVADPGGKRIGSGGSTLCCLLEVVNREAGIDGGSGNIDEVARVLGAKRILIVHAGGDSRRLPAYGPCGKILVPVPGENDTGLPLTLFDRQLPIYLALPAAPAATGQIVITSGDVLLRFDPAEVRYTHSGLTALACHSEPEVARNHGVFCRGAGDEVRVFLQKPSLDEQRACGAVNLYGQALLDIGVMQFDASSAAHFLRTFGVATGPGGLRLAGPMGDEVHRAGLDFYREICCALGTDTDLARYLQSVRQSGSNWDAGLLEQVFEQLSSISFHLQILPRCEFLDFGTSRKIIASGTALLREERGIASLNTCVEVNNEVEAAGRISGGNSWVEGCRIGSTLTLGGENVVVGVHVTAATTLPAGACIDVIPGRDRAGRSAWFLRCYGVDDTFKNTIDEGATFCGIPMMEWLSAVGAQPGDVWGGDVAAEQRTVWGARLFPASGSPLDYQNWLWMFAPAGASEDQRGAWRSADRYSLSEIAGLTDHASFDAHREEIRSRELRRSLRRLFRPDSGFSAAELADVMRRSADPTDWVAAVVPEAAYHAREAGSGLEALVVPRILHTLGTALLAIESIRERPMREALPGLEERLRPEERAWLDSIGLGLQSASSVRSWADRAAAVAFELVGRTILSSDREESAPPQNSLRTDEIVWGRAPARLDTGGGWTDTPPYSLEHGGCVVNTAVNLNGQPPIQAYARVIDRPVIRISSIDLGTQIEISRLEELLDYRQADGQFGLVKAALALSGFSPRLSCWPSGISLQEMLRQFGGGIEVTTLAAVPKGSGLGTSSIMGTVILAVIHRVLGITLSQRELFNSVLRLEQALTTGGGWQDQIGGALGGAKMITAEAGLVPDAHVRYLPADVIDPKMNGGCTLLYYTGVTRLAKNILEQVVGRYLSRDRRAMATLGQIRALVPAVADALSRKDVAGFGSLVSTAWELNKELDPNSTNAEIEALLERVAPHVFGAKLLGAGAGGFLLMVCRSSEDAHQIREMLTRRPPNPRARFFDMEVNNDGLVVTVC